MDRQTDECIDKQMEGYTKKLMYRQTDEWIFKQMDGYTKKWIEIQTDEGIYRQRNGWRDKQMDGWTNRCTYQQFSNVHFVFLGTQMHWSQTILCLDVHFGIGLHQQINHVTVTLLIRRYLFIRFIPKGVV